MYKERLPVQYQVISDASGNRYHFFCEASGALGCTTNPTRAKTSEEELRLAWEIEGRKQFNQCHQCGRWVIDAMFNADVLGVWIVHRGRKGQNSAPNVDVPCLWGIRFAGAAAQNCSIER